MMQESRDVFGGIHQLEFAHIEGVNRRQVHAAAGLHSLQHRFYLPGLVEGAEKQLPQPRIGGSAIDFRQQVHQESGLGGVVGGVAVDIEKAQQAVNQVVDSRDQVGVPGNSL